MRETRLYGSEGGEAKAFLTPINKDPITLRPMIAHGLPLSLCFITSNF